MSICSKQDTTFLCFFIFQQGCRKKLGEMKTKGSVSSTYGINRRRQEDEISVKKKGGGKGKKIGGSEDL